MVVRLVVETRFARNGEECASTAVLLTALVDALAYGLVRRHRYASEP
jgi:hypothetical protein